MAYIVFFAGKGCFRRTQRMFFVLENPGNLVISEKSFMLCMRHKEIVKRHTVEGQVGQCIWEAEARELKATSYTTGSYLKNK